MKSLYTLTFILFDTALNNKQSITLNFWYSLLLYIQSVSQPFKFSNFIVLGRKHWWVKLMVEKNHQRLFSWNLLEKFNFNFAEASRETRLWYQLCSNLLYTKLNFFQTHSKLTKVSGVLHQYFNKDGYIYTMI